MRNEVLAKVSNELTMAIGVRSIMCLANLIGCGHTSASWIS